MCAVVSPSSAGDSARHLSVAYRQRGANRQPAGGSTRSGGAPGMEYSRSRVSADFSGSAWNSASVYGWRGFSYSADVSVSSTTLPAYITATRSARPAMTPRSWVTMMTAMPSRCRRSSMSSRICFWIVTSSAVVGSSAMSSLGSQASAIAIMTRWRMPPENWCGYSSTRSLARGRPTRSRTSTARSYASCLLTSRCSSTASAICLPTVCVGLSEDSGSWKIIPTSSPRILRSSSGRNWVTSLPASLIVPPAMRPPLGSNCMIDSAVIVLPQPDSPTMPSVSPSATSSDTPSTACTTPSRNWISVRRSVISRSATSCCPPYRRCSRVSNASRSASPMKLNEMQVKMIAMPGG